MTDIDVCVNTYKREHLLLQLLDSLSRQVLPSSVSFRVFVVDNDPQGSAKPVCEQFMIRGLDLFYQQEPIVNISLARNKAMAPGQGQFIAFIDDDETAAPDWLKHFQHTAETFELDVLHGPVTFTFPPRTSSWITLCKAFTRAPVLPTAQPIGYERSTTNCFIRRSTLSQLSHWFDPAYGRSGSEDTEFFKRLGENSDISFGWCPGASTREFVPAKRANYRWLSQRYLRFGMNSCYRERKTLSSSLFYRMSWSRHRILVRTLIKLSRDSLLNRGPTLIDTYLDFMFVSGYLLNYYFRIRFTAYW